MANNEEFIISGVRGSGKTVAMTSIADFYKKNDWIVIDLNPECDLLEQLTSKLLDEGKFKNLLLKLNLIFF